MAWMTRLRHIGRREDSAHQRIEIKLLRIFEDDRPHRVGSKEGGDSVFGQMAVLDRFIVVAKVDEDLFVAFVEGISGHAAVVVDDGAPAAVLQDACKFGAGVFQVEPMHRLADGDQIDGMIGETGRFGGSVDTFEMRILRGQRSACLAHLLIRLDGDDVEGVCEKDFREQAGTSGDVGNDRCGVESTVSREEIRDSRRIARAMEAVALNAIGESLRWVDDGQAILDLFYLSMASATELPPPRQRAAT